MKEHFLLVLLSILLSISTQAQVPGYRGNRLMAGSGISYPFVSLLEDNVSTIKPIPCVNMNYVLSRKHVISLTLGSSSIAGYRIEDDAAQINYVRTIKNEFVNFHLQSHTKATKGAIAPVGTYYSVGVSAVQSNPLPSIQNFDEKASRFLFFQIGCGNRQVILSRIVVDYGLNASILQVKAQPESANATMLNLSDGKYSENLWLKHLILPYVNVGVLLF